MNRRVACATGTLVGMTALLAGCSSGTTPGTTSLVAPNSAASSASAATPASWSTPEAQQHYLEMVAPDNEAAAVIRQFAQSGSKDMVTLRADCTNMVNSSHSFAVALGGGNWPLAVKGPIADLVSALGDDSVQFGRCARAQTISEASQALTAPSTSAAKSETVRTYLGLPSGQ